MVIPDGATIESTAVQQSLKACLTEAVSAWRLLRLRRNPAFLLEPASGFLELVKKGMYWFSPSSSSSSSSS